MTVVKQPDSTKLNTQLVGYVNRRTGQIVCLQHRPEIQSPRDSWAPLHLNGPIQARDPSTTPVICGECGSWLNDEATGYAITSPPDGYWKRCLRRARAHRDR